MTGSLWPDTERDSGTPQLGDPGNNPEGKEGHKKEGHGITSPPRRGGEAPASKKKKGCKGEGGI